MTCCMNSGLDIICCTGVICPLANAQLSSLMIVVAADPRTLVCRRQLLFRFAILLDPSLVGGFKLLLVLKPLQVLDLFHVLPFQIFGDPLRRNFTANNSRFSKHSAATFITPASEQPCRRFVTCEQSRRYRSRQRSRRQKISLTRDWP